jgi:hypothetical protein
MMYYENSILDLEWTNQHGCGGNEADDPQTVNCNIILQVRDELSPLRPTSDAPLLSIEL